MNSTLKEMLLSLQSAIYSDILNMVHQFKAEVGEFVCTFNELVDAHSDRREEVKWIKAKLADLEDHSRRSNLKNCGIPESVNSPDLRAYFTKLLSDLLADVPPSELFIDCQNLLDKAPRDTIFHIHFSTMLRRISFGQPGTWLQSSSSMQVYPFTLICLNTPPYSKQKSLYHH